jgi:hypothetical protein
MKRLILAISLCGIVLLAGNTVFAQQCQPNYTPIQCGYFQEAYQDGAADAQNNRSNDYKRYKSKMEGGKYENYFKQGYDAGYSSIRPYQRWDRDQKSAYDDGYSKGANDKRRNISSLPQRYEGQYNRTYEGFFTQGYYDGYDNKSKTYDVPVGTNIQPVNPTNPTFPTNPTVPTNPTFPTTPVKIGTATGNVSWSGRVDDRTNIIIQGDQVTEQVIAGNGSFTTSKNINGVLPRVASIISVSKNGRGEVFVAQQPSRDNNYTAIVQVVDTKRGAENYNVQISWQATEPLEEPYQSGRVSWRGRVDQTANIIISGNSVQTQDASGTGVQVTSSNVTGSLARRPGTVSVSKRGRGSATVVQQPTPENGFVAIVQIFDADRGAGDYEIEITW